MRPVRAVVGRSQRIALAASPRADDAVDRARIEVRPIGEHDDCGFRVEVAEPAAKGCARAASPLRAVHDARVRLDRVGAGDNCDVVDGAPFEGSEDRRQEDALLRRPEARRLAGREHDRRYDVSTLAFEMTIARDGCSFASPSFPIRSTTSRPDVTLPTIA